MLMGQSVSRWISPSLTPGRSKKLNFPERRAWFRSLKESFVIVEQV